MMQIAIFSLIQQFVEWCDSHYLLLNVTKTKEMIIDFHKNVVHNHVPLSFMILQLNESVNINT